MAEPQDGPALEALLEFLRDSRGFDFTGYKRPTLIRRIGRRMQDVDIATFDDYLDFLQVYPEEFAPLFNTILINVTRFFRDEEAWRVVAEELIPAILARRPDDQSIRVWSPACSSGPEPYTMAILFAEAMGVEQAVARVKIYGTDVDEEALDQARHGVYDAKDLEGVPNDLKARYFDPAGDSAYIFGKELRRAVIFGRHDLIRDAPIGRLDLLSCRNTLMYFNAELQAQILRRFHFALRDDGYLVLGSAETLLAQSHLFEPLDLRNRIFVRASLGAGVRGALELPVNHVDRRDRVDGGPPEVLSVAFKRTALVQIVVSPGGLLLAANDSARHLFGTKPADIGRPFSDHELSYRPTELRALIDEGARSREIQRREGVRWRGKDGDRWFDIEVTPLTETEEYLGALICFRDVTVLRQLEEELQTSKDELETAYEELQSSNEELETTNEELQSTVEELETTNEELQSSNEELETMNEELQSTNAQLESLNDALQERGTDLDEANTYLRSILRSLGSAVLVVDRELRLRLWSEQAEQLWGLRADEVLGRELLGLDIGLSVDELREPARRSMDSHESVGPFPLMGHTRTGHALRCNVRCLPLIDEDRGVTGAIVLIDAAKV